MVKFTLQLPDAAAEWLRVISEQTGCTPEELLREKVEEWLGGEANDFLEAANHVLRKNAELYRRLA